MMDGQLTVRVKTGPAHVLVTLAGNCDHSTGLEFRDGLATEVARGAQRLIVDLSEVGFMDSEAVHVLLDLKAVLTEWGGSLVLVNPQPIVARVLSLMGADEVIPVADTVAEALTLNQGAAPEGQV
jgi:anti-sigma B factor antagonist